MSSRGSIFGRRIYRFESKPDVNPRRRRLHRTTEAQRNPPAQPGVGSSLPIDVSSEGAAYSHTNNSVNMGIAGESSIWSENPSNEGQTTISLAGYGTPRQSLVEPGLHVGDVSVNGMGAGLFSVQPPHTASPLNNLNHPVVETGPSVVEDATGSDNILSMIGHLWWGLHEYLIACLDERTNMQYCLTLAEKRIQELEATLTSVGPTMAKNLSHWKGNNPEKKVRRWVLRAIRWSVSRRLMSNI